MVERGTQEMREEPVWVPAVVVQVIHREQLLEHGGRLGVRHPHAIEASTARAQQRFAYDPAADLADLAASYAHGFATSHGFVDGNKRVAWTVARIFLYLNGYTVARTDREKLDTMLAVAAGTMTEGELAAWLRSALIPLPPEGAALAEMTPTD